MIGEKFGKLTVLSECEERKRGCKVYKCICDCGNITYVMGTYLKIGRTLSCGCLRGKKLIERNIEYRLNGVYKNMKTRCYNKNYYQYKDWGGRGIIVCDEWRNNFQAFCDWAIENGYKEGLQIDRIDNNKGYSPDNCRWVDVKTQSNNRRSNIYLTYNGKTQTMKQWAEELDINYMTIYMRHMRGYDDKSCLFGKRK